jgi:cell surface protein SprA
LEPLPDFKIELSATRTETHGTSEFFRFIENPAPGKFESQSPSEMGTFSMSYSSFRTSFLKGDDVFQSFLDTRSSMSQQVGAKNPNSHRINDTLGYAEGYNQTSQDVLIPAFLSAYSGKSSAKASTDMFPKVPKVNWRATYDGLGKLKKMKKVFKSFTISHAYRSSYSVGGYTSNLLYHADAAGNPDTKDTVTTNSANPNFISKYTISSVSIMEQWSPLIKIEAVLNNSFSMNFEFKKDRNLALGITSKTITEIAGREIITGVGYRIKDIQLGKLQIQGKPIKSDLTLKCDVSFRKNITTMRRIAEEVSQPTGGTDIISIKVSADYTISKTISLRLFYDRIINKPVISTSFPTTNTNIGISLRLVLGGN